VRGDGSTNHEGLFDLSSGQYLRAGTHQGWRPDSAWARGQAWALYGFGEAFELTGDRRYLDVAHRCADFYVASTPGGVPPNDWDEPDPERAYESSAAAAAAGGLWRLAKLTDDSGRRAIYRGTALKIMDRLVSPEFLANETPEWEGILRHGTYHERNRLGVDESVMFGDYFFVEALAMMLEDGFE
jgi:unsaturated chondroitin disaccharide hydrolase